MTSAEFLPESLSLSLAYGRVFEDYLAVTMAVPHAALLRSITLCNSEKT